MISLDVADLVVIAARTLDIGTDAALDRMDIAAAQDALAAARAPAAETGGKPRGLAARAPALEPGGKPRRRAAAASAGVRLVHALLRHPPIPGHGQRVAVAAGLQFLSLNGWRADLDPPATAAVVVEALASGRLSPDAAAAWLAPRLGQARHFGPVPGVRSRRRPPVSLPAVRVPAIRVPAIRVPVGRAVAGALLAASVTGVTLFAAACSRGPDLPAAPSGGVSAVRTPPVSGTAPADSAYAACMRSHGVAGFAYPAATDVAVPVIGIGLSSARFSAAEVACGR